MTSLQEGLFAKKLTIASQKMPKDKSKTPTENKSKKTKNGLFRKPSTNLSREQLVRDQVHPLISLLLLLIKLTAL